MNLIFCKIKQAETSWISFFFLKLEKPEKNIRLGNWNFVCITIEWIFEYDRTFYCVWRLEIYIFLQAWKIYRNMDSIFCRSQKNSKHMSFIVCKLKKAQRTWSKSKNGSWWDVYFFMLIFWLFFILADKISRFAKFWSPIENLNSVAVWEIPYLNWRYAFVRFSHDPLNLRKSTHSICSNRPRFANRPPWFA